jgi:hypothetical protein
MALEVKILDDGKIVARRSDGQPLSDTDRAEVKRVSEQIDVGLLCWNCGAEWSDTTDISGNHVKVCWRCAKWA